MDVRLRVQVVDIAEVSARSIERIAIIVCVPREPHNAPARRPRIVRPFGACGYCRCDCSGKGRHGGRHRADYDGHAVERDIAGPEPFWFSMVAEMTRIRGPNRLRRGFRRDRWRRDFVLRVLVQASNSCGYCELTGLDGSANWHTLGVLVGAHGQICAMARWLSSRCRRRRFFATTYDSELSPW